MTKHAIVEVDLGELGWDLSRELQLSAADKHSNWYKQEPKHKQRGQYKEENNSKVRIVVRPAKKLHQPVADHGDASSAGDGASGQAYWIIAEEEGWPYPVLAESLKHFYVPPDSRWPASAPSDHPSDEDLSLGTPDFTS